MKVRGDYPRAERMYKDAMMLAPRSATAIGNFANFQQRVKGNPALAQELYLKALEMDPMHNGVKRNYSILLRDFPELRTPSTEKILPSTPAHIRAARERPVIGEEVVRGPGGREVAGGGLEPPGAPADAGEARPRQTAVEARGGPAPRDGRRGRGFASGSRARAPPARGRVRRARGVTGRHAGALRPTGRRRARARRCAPRRGSSRGREPTHTRFLGWRVGPVVFFIKAGGRNRNIKKTLSPPRKRAGRAQRGAQRTTCEHERRSW